MKGHLLAGLVALAMDPLSPPAREDSTTRVIERTLPATGVAELTVDNVFGSIQVTAGGDDEIRFTARETITARSAAALAAARQEVRLDVSQEPGRIVLYVDGPFRGNRSDPSHRRDPGYRVRHDFTIRTPPGLHLTLRTVNEGEVAVREVRGGFEASNVNGGIELLEMGGSGRAQTVNGAVRIAFAALPSGPASFTTVNGDVDVSFPPALAADVRFETMNGEIFTDFPFTSAPGTETSIERRGGRFRLSLEKAVAIRVAGGGPQIRLQTLNGDLILRQAD